MKKLLLVVAVLFVSSLSFAQLTAGRMAVTSDIGNSLGGVYALSENMSVEGGVTFVSSSPSVGNSTTTIGLNAGVKMYQPAMENVTLFYGGKFGFSSAGDPAYSTISLTAIGGAEYWFSPRFSWGGYIGFGFSSYGVSGAKTTDIGTQGLVQTLTWWFN
jgi:hypothetical protein